MAPRALSRVVIRVLNAQMGVLSFSLVKSRKQGEADSHQVVVRVLNAQMWAFILARGRRRKVGEVDGADSHQVVVRILNTQVKRGPEHRHDRLRAREGKGASGGEARGGEEGRRGGGAGGGDAKEYGGRAQGAGV